MGKRKNERTGGNAWNYARQRAGSPHHRRQWRMELAIVLPVVAGIMIWR
jgi:hypothetical protein